MGALTKPDTQTLLAGLRQYAPAVELRFESLAVAFDGGLPWYARVWCAVLLGRTAAVQAGAVEVLGGGLSDPEPHVRAAVVGVLGRAGGLLAQPLLRRVAADRAERGQVRNAAVRAIGKVVGSGRG